ncbi:hypothetical protein ACFQ3Z_15810 [Streptomyces nogalater]
MAWTRTARVRPHVLRAVARREDPRWPAPRSAPTLPWFSRPPTSSTASASPYWPRPSARRCRNSPGPGFGRATRPSPLHVPGHLDGRAEGRLHPRPRRGGFHRLPRRPLQAEASPRGAGGAKSNFSARATAERRQEVADYVEAHADELGWSPSPQQVAAAWLEHRFGPHKRT